MLDGAMGTMLGRRAPPDSPAGAPNYDLLSLTRPDLVAQVHEDYLEAGSDIIATNTFGATRVTQVDFGLEARVTELNAASVAIARGAADRWTDRTPDRPRFVAGTLGPTRARLSVPSRGIGSQPVVTFDALHDAYVEQARALIRGGVDLLLVETATDPRNVDACVRAIHRIFAEVGFELPILISMTLTGSGTTPSGHGAGEFWSSVAPLRPTWIGINCGLGTRHAGPFLAELAHLTTTATAFVPSAGLPDADGAYPETPAGMATAVRRLAVSGLVDAVGGCCGTTPAHIRAIGEAIAGVPPRSRSMAP